MTKRKLHELHGLSYEELSRQFYADHFHGRAAASTVEALMYSLRECGTKALGEPDTIRRLSELSDEQFRNVVVRLQKFQPHIAPAWKPEELAVLTIVRRKVRAENS
jgi:hypothetical protein